MNEYESDFPPWYVHALECLEMGMLPVFVVDDEGDLTLLQFAPLDARSASLLIHPDQDVRGRVISRVICDVNDAQKEPL